MKLRQSRQSGPRLQCSQKVLSIPYCLLDHLLLWGRPLLHSQKDPLLRLHLHRFARIQLVLELLLRLYMRHLEFLVLPCLLAVPWVLEL